MGYDQYTVPDTVAVRSTLRPWPLVPFFSQFLWRTLNSKPPTIPFVAYTFSDKRVSMGWCLLRLSAKILAVLRLSVNFFQLRLTKKLISFVSKSLINLHFLYLQSKIKVLGSSRDWKWSYSFWKKFNIWYIILFIKYSISNIILRIEMSIVHSKIIFVNKQKQTRERQTQGWGATFIFNRNDRFHARDRVFVWDGLSVWEFALDR